MCEPLDSPTGRGLHELRLDELLVAMAADQPAPGAGAAGGIALALAAACAGKAAAISARHRADDGALGDAQSELGRLRREAIDAATRDGQRFSAWLASRDASRAPDLIAAEQGMLRLADSIEALVTRLEPLIGASMRGDLVAARSLIEAARRIERSNLEETRRAAR